MLKLGDVQETALIPLAVRAEETKRKNARIHDFKAVRIIDELGVDTKKYNNFFSHEGVVARTAMIDREVKNLLKKYPDAICVNLGCGLDDRFSRVDNGLVRWFNIDLPDSIEVREKVFEETEREHMLAGNILEDHWTKAIPKGNVTVIIAEGLLMYFSRAQVKKILNIITNSFEKGFILAELMHPKMMKEKFHDTVKQTNAKFGWGTETGEELLFLDPKLTLINERSFWEEMKKYTAIGKIGSVLMPKMNNRLVIYRYQ